MPDTLNGPLAHSPQNDKDFFDDSPEAMARAAAAANGQLQSFIERYENLDEAKQAVLDDQKELKKEIKGAGFDTKVFLKVIRYRKQDAAKWQEEEAIFDLYLSAIGQK